MTLTRWTGTGSELDDEVRTGIAEMAQNTGHSRGGGPPRVIN